MMATTVPLLMLKILQHSLSLQLYYSAFQNVGPYIYNYYGLLKLSQKLNVVSMTHFTKNRHFWGLRD